MAEDQDIEDFGGFAQRFFDDVWDQAVIARERFPQPNPSIAALTEEAGELARELLHFREGKSSASWPRVRAEAVQVAVMALRTAFEGDATLGRARPPNAAERF